MDEAALSAEQYTIWVRSCQAPIALHKLAGWDHLFYDLGVCKPALFVYRAWGDITLLPDPSGLALLQEVRFCPVADTADTPVVLRPKRWLGLVLIKSLMIISTSFVPMLKTCFMTTVCPCSTHGVTRFSCLQWL